MKEWIRITPHDNVATLLIDCAKNTILNIDEISVTASEDIPYGHKIALKDIAQGESVIKYNECIAQAQLNIKAGQWVHIHNCRSLQGGCQNG